MFDKLLAISAGIFSLYACGYCVKKGLDDSKTDWYDLNVVLSLCFIGEFVMSIYIAISI